MLSKVFLVSVQSNNQTQLLLIVTVLLESSNYSEKLQPGKGEKLYESQKDSSNTQQNR